MTKLATLGGLAAAATLIGTTAAGAHSAEAVERILERHGYNRIEFTDARPPNYMANACRDGVRYHFHVNYYGEVTERREIGSCGYRAERIERDPRVYEVYPREHRRWGHYPWWQRRHSWNDWN